MYGWDSSVACWSAMNISSLAAGPSFTWLASGSRCENVYETRARLLVDGSWPMLDFLYMIFFEFGRDIGGCRTGTAHDRAKAQFRGITRIGLLILISSLGAAPCAQLQSQNSNQGGAQSPSTPDCSDPLLASTLECSGQTQFGQTQGAPLNNQALGGQGNMALSRAVSITIIPISNNFPGMLQHGIRRSEHRFRRSRQPSSSSSSPRPPARVCLSTEQTCSVPYRPLLHRST